MKPEKPTQRDANQGEGARSSARRYDRQLREFIAGGQVEPAAHEAEAYVVNKPEEARAERRARRGPQPTRISIDEMIARSRTVVERVRPVVHRVLGKLRARLVRK